MRALISGISGQDGSYLSELLLSKGYEIHGLACALDDYEGVSREIRETQPDELYHLAAQTFVLGEEFETMRTNSGGTHHVLAAVREHAPGCRLFLAGSSEMFGDVDRSPQNESTPMRPRGVYGISKLTAYLLMRNYREAHGLHASCGILYNHESPRRSEQFVTGKIVAAAVRIKAGIDKELRLGNLDSVRDWGDARDYVRAMWLMLQQPAPDDYVIATGQGRTIRDLLDAAFAAVELDWRDYVVKDERFYRPTEKCPMIGDATKARTRLGWAPKREFAAMVREMVAEKLTAYGLGTVRPS
jgi:GDPmannose 4,6-dehydratase